MTTITKKSDDVHNSIILHSVTNNKQNDPIIALQKLDQILKSYGINNAFMPYEINEKKPLHYRAYSRLEQTINDVSNGDLGLGLMTDKLAFIDCDYRKGYEFLKRLGIDLHDYNQRCKLLGWFSGKSFKEIEPFEYSPIFNENCKFTIVVKRTAIFDDYFQKLSEYSKAGTFDFKGIDFRSGYGGQCQIPSYSLHPDTGKPYQYLNDLSQVEIVEIPNEILLKEYFDEAILAKQRDNNLKKITAEELSEIKARYELFKNGELKEYHLTSTELQRFVYNPFLGKIDTIEKLGSLIDPRHNFNCEGAGLAFYRSSSSVTSFTLNRDYCKYTGEKVWLWYDWQTQEGGTLFDYQRKIRENKTYLKEGDRQRYFRIFARKIKEVLDLEIYLPSKELKKIGEALAGEIIPKSNETKEIKATDFFKECATFKQKREGKSNLEKSLKSYEIIAKDSEEIMRAYRETWDLLPSQYIVNISETGWGKSTQAALFLAFAFGVSFLRYSTNDYLNLTHDNFEKWLIQTSPNGGIKKVGNKNRIFNHGDDPKKKIKEASCKNYLLMNELRAKGIQSKKICELCPFKKGCEYREEKAKLATATRVVMHPSMIQYLEFAKEGCFNPKDAMLIIDEELPLTIDSKVTKDNLLDFLNELEIVLKELDIDSKEILSKLNEVYLMFDKPRGSFGLYSHEFDHINLNIDVEILDKLKAKFIEIETKRNDLKAIMKATGEGIKGLNTDQQLEMIAQNTKKLPQIKQRNLIIDIIEIISNHNHGALTINKKNELVITVRNERLIEGIKQYRKVLILNATLDINKFRWAMSLPPYKITIVRTEYTKTPNLHKIQIYDCGKMSRSRKPTQFQYKQDIVDYGINEFGEKNLFIVDFKKFTNPNNLNECAWLADTVGSNLYDKKKALIIVGNCIPNLTQESANFKAIYGRSPLLERKIVNETIIATNGVMEIEKQQSIDKEWFTFIDNIQKANTLQAIGRIRANLRLNEQLYIFFVGEYHHSHGRCEMLKLIELTGIERNKQALRIYDILTVIDDLMEKKTPKITFNSLSEIIKSNYKHIPTTNHKQIHRDLFALFNDEYSYIYTLNESVIRNILKNYPNLNKGLKDTHKTQINRVKNNIIKIKKARNNKVIFLKSNETKPSIKNIIIDNKPIEIDEKVEKVSVSNIRNIAKIIDNKLIVDERKINLFDTKKYISNRDDINEYLDKNYVMLSQLNTTNFIDHIMYKFDNESFKVAKADPKVDLTGNGGYFECFVGGGFYEDVFELDFKSCYPEVIKNHSIGNKKDTNNILLEVISNLIDLRKSAKLVNNVDKARAFKQIVNAITGYYGMDKAKFNDHIAYGIITAKVRVAIKQAIAIIKEELKGEILSVSADGIKVRGVDRLLVQKTIKEKLPDHFNFETSFSNCKVFFTSTKKSNFTKGNGNSFVVFDQDNNLISAKGDLFNSKHPKLKEFSCTFTHTYLTKSAKVAIDYYENYRLTVNEKTLKLIDNAYKVISNTLNLPQSHQNIA